MEIVTQESLRNVQMLATNEWENFGGIAAKLNPNWWNL